MNQKERLNISVKSQDHSIKTYRIGKHTSIQRLLKTHCQRMDAVYGSVVFVIEGDRFDQKKTPAQLKLKNGAIIEALTHMHGGGRSQELLNASS